MDASCLVMSNGPPGRVVLSRKVPGLNGRRKTKTRQRLPATRTDRQRLIVIAIRTVSAAPAGRSICFDILSRLQAGDSISRWRERELRFAVQSPRKSWASPRSHGVPRRNVPGCVNISVERVTAGHAGEEGLALAALCCDVPARRAALARERGTYLLHPARSFIFQPADQQTPAGPQDLAVQPGLLSYLPAGSLHGSLSRARHVADLQILNPDHVKTSRQIRAGLLGPVLARVRFAGLEAGDGQLHTDAAIRAALGPRQLTLKMAEPALSHGPELRHGEQFASRQGSRDGYATVDSDNRARTRPWNQLRDCGECDVPAVRAVPGHPVRLRCGDGAGPAEPNPSRLRHPDPADPPGQPLDLPRPERHDPESLIPTRLAPRRFAVSARRRSTPSPERSPAAPAAGPSGCRHAAKRAPRGRR